MHAHAGEQLDTGSALALADDRSASCEQHILIVMAARVSAGRPACAPGVGVSLDRQRYAPIARGCQPLPGIGQSRAEDVNQPANTISQFGNTLLADGKPRGEHRGHLFGRRTKIAPLGRELDQHPPLVARSRAP